MRQTAWGETGGLVIYKKEPHSKNAMRPKRVGYWKASYYKVTRFPPFVKGKFCRFRTSFVERGR